MNFFTAGCTDPVDLPASASTTAGLRRKVVMKESPGMFLSLVSGRQSDGSHGVGALPERHFGTHTALPMNRLTVMMASIVSETHRSAPSATQLTINSPSAKTMAPNTKSISHQ